MKTNRFSPDDSHGLITAEQVREELGVCKATVADLHERHGLTSRTGTQRYYRRSAVQQALDLASAEA